MNRMSSSTNRLSWFYRVYKPNDSSGKRYATRQSSRVSFRHHGGMRWSQPRSFKPAWSQRWLSHLSVQCESLLANSSYIDSRQSATLDQHCIPLASAVFSWGILSEMLMLCSEAPRFYLTTRFHFSLWRCLRVCILCRNVAWFGVRTHVRRNIKCQSHHN